MKLDIFVRDEIRRRNLDVYLSEADFQEIITLAIEDGFQVKHAIDFVLRHVPTNQAYALRKAA